MEQVKPYVWPLFAVVVTVSYVCLMLVPSAPAVLERIG
jgi:hypothetical protein